MKLIDSKIKNSGIYCIENTINQHCYVGSARNLLKRQREHYYALRKGSHINPHLQNAWNKYGEASFIFRILEYCLEANLLERENYYIKLLKPVYNAVQDAQRLIPSAEMNAKRAESLRRYRKAHPELLLQIVEKVKQFYKEHPEEEEKRKKRALELARAMAEKNKGRKLSPEHIEKCRLKRIGRVVSSETRKKLSETLKERYKTHPGTMLGRSLTMELRQHHSEAAPKQEVHLYSIDGVYIRSFDSLKDAAKHTLTTSPHICSCARGEYKTAGGYMWRYEKEDNIAPLKGCVVAFYEEEKRLFQSKRQASLYFNIPYTSFIAKLPKTYTLLGKVYKLMYY